MIRRNTKRILCVVDLTESTKQVLEVATRITKAYGTHLIVLFPYRLVDYGGWGDFGSLKSKLEKEAKDRFDDVIKDIPGFEKISSGFYAEIGFIADRVSAHVKRDDLYMVVIGQQQSSRVNDGKVYSLHDLISNSKLPFLIVPAQVPSNASAVPM